MTKFLSDAKILEELDLIDSDIDDSSLDPDYNINGEDTADSTSENSEPCSIRRKKTNQQTSHETGNPELKKSTRKRKCKKQDWKNSVRKERRLLAKK